MNKIRVTCYSTAFVRSYFKYQLDAQIIIYSYNVTIPLHVSSNKYPSSGGHIVYMQPMVTVTLKQVSGRILLNLICVA
jgi:hypothetical protein